MNIRKFIAVAIAAAFVAMTSAVNAGPVKPNKDGKSRIQLQKENQELKAALDSLKQELEKLQYTDSISQEIIEILEENEDKSVAGINPEDYTAEISDSLLNVWYTQKKNTEDDLKTYDMDSVHFKSNVPDEVYIERDRKSVV